MNKNGNIYWTRNYDDWTRAMDWMEGKLVNSIYSEIPPYYYEPNGCIIIEQ